MKKMMVPALSGIVLSAGLLVGCSSAPTQQMDAAQQALQTAEEAQADLYVADLYQAAEDSMAAAQEEMMLQDGKFALTRNYDRVTTLLQYVEQTATTAATQVDEQKAALRLETEMVIVQAQEALAQVQTLMAQAPQGKDGSVALVAIGQDTGTAQTTLAEAQTALQNDEVATAHELAQTALDKANALITELNNAISKTQRS